MISRNIIYLLVFTAGLLASCKESSSDTDKEDSADQAVSDVTPIKDSMPPADPYLVSARELDDDTVFNDGSRPVSWSNAGVSDSIAAKRFVRKLQTWARDNYVDSIGNYLSYPMRNPAIPDRKNFKLNYSSYFTDAVKAALADQNLRQIFRTQQGFMIGQGQIWMRERSGSFQIFAINN